MLRYIAKRVLSAIITIWFIMTLTFTLMNAIPGDPFASEKMNDPVIIANMKAKYAKAEVNVDKICKVLEGHQIQLLKDAAMLDQMYQLNLTYYKELSMYILYEKRNHNQ